MKLPFAQIDAFASGPFTGNPAAVMPLTEWLADEMLQAIAAENNLAETAFLIPMRAARPITSCAGSPPPSKSRCAAMRRWRAGITCSARISRAT